MRPRPSKDEYYLNIAKAVSARATCLHRCYGAVIVNTAGGRDRIVATGYCGATRGREDCMEAGLCDRSLSFEDGVIIRGQNYEACRGAHGEMNAIMQASAEELIGATIYIYGRFAADDRPAEAGPCHYCLRMIRNSGISMMVIGKEGGGWYKSTPDDFVPNSYKPPKPAKQVKDRQLILPLKRDS